MRRKSPSTRLRPFPILACAAILMAALMPPAAEALEGSGPAPAIPRAEDSVRYGPRQGVTVPDGAIVPGPRRSLATTFAPETDAIVARLDLATYDGFLQGISGWVPVVVGGSSVTFQTRHSTTPAGQVCWQYAFETLKALGYDVRYQHYTRFGNALRNIIASIPGETR